MRYGVNEGSWWCSLQPDKAEIWDLHNHRAGRREGAEGKKHKWEKESESVHRGERRQNMQARGRARMQESVREEREETGEILTWKVKCCGADTLCKNRVKVCVKETMCCGEEGVMCLGREPPTEKGEGCEWACSVWTDIGCRLSFSPVSRTNTPSSSDTYHTPGDRKNMAWIIETRRRKRQRETDSAWDFPSFSSLATLQPFSSSTGKPRESRALLSNQQRSNLLATLLHRTRFVCRRNQHFFCRGNYASGLQTCSFVFGKYFLQVDVPVKSCSAKQSLKIWHQEKQRWNL